MTEPRAAAHRVEYLSLASHAPDLVVAEMINRHAGGRVSGSAIWEVIGMGWNQQKLWKSCEALVDRLPAPEPFTPHRLLTILGEEQGVRTVFTPMRVQGRMPCGLLVLTSDQLLVFYAVNVSPLHQANTLLHEAGHLIRGDLSTQSGKLLERVLALAPNLRPEIIQRVLGRTGYDDEAEAGAELIAALIAERAGRRLSYDSTPGGLPEAATDPVASASAVFGCRGSWEL